MNILSRRHECLEKDSENVSFHKFPFPRTVIIPFLTGYAVVSGVGEFVWRWDPYLPPYLRKMQV